MTTQNIDLNLLVSNILKILLRKSLIIYTRIYSLGKCEIKATEQNPKFSKKTHIESAINCSDPLKIG